MKAIRKLLAMALVVVMVLSMSTFVFATERALPQYPCFDHVYTYEVRPTYRFIDRFTCGYFEDLHGTCINCGDTISIQDDNPSPLNHFVEDGNSYCWQCHSYGCAMPS